MSFLKMNWIWWIVGSVIVLGILWSVGIWWYTKNIETPSYTIVRNVDDVEIRKYEPIIIAQVTEKKEGQRGLNSGFSVLADYIFGNNTAQTSISMTSPVLDEKQDSSPISMTTPVIDTFTEEGRIISFTMPSKWTMETLPQPNNPNIKIRETLEEQKAVLSFFLFRFENEETRNNAEEKLLQILKENNISHKNDVSFAFYNPPLTPFFLRRNEVMVTLNN